MKKTQAAPKTVPITGIPNPAIIPFILNCVNIMQNYRNIENEENHINGYKSIIQKNG